ncbi:enoyl-[acyl-carrier-protein] reductase FabK [Pseudothermotoga sp.]|nr:enoyl-[acyl-carrier-protein] reductase FabK [Pseudothermotoga sp.]MCX7812355.1 enoyl-[acyl-carrier-protein] reductase FabK [Pseudothermotoga sp.]MDW8139425.1 enoyl-[acyl-carrier-protein] reductase FabK [Pseudothermotoga sp.]
MKNRVTELFEIDYPIVMGGMAWAGTAKLAAAVSNAGGLGVIGSGAMRAEQLRDEIEKIKSLTNKPFGVNIMLASPYVEELLETVVEEKVPVVTFGAGNPTKFIQKLKEHGIKVAVVVASDSLAKLVERAGADTVVAEGMESGGHIGEVSTIVLVNKVARSVKIPVIAAGGIADGRAMAAAFALGAEGIQMGTRFLATVESEVHENYKKRILSASIRDTVVTGAKLGHPARVLKTPFARQVCDLEVKSPEEAEMILVGSLKRAVIDGDIDSGSFMAGQVCGLIEDVPTVKELIERIMKEFFETVEKLCREVISC